MNNCHIIAACQVAKKGHNNYGHYIDFNNGQIYYKVNLRKYYHFEPTLIVTPIYEPLYIGSVYAPICQCEVQVSPVKIEAQTIAIEHCFYVYDKQCPEGIDNYIKKNLNKFITNNVWYDSDRQALDLYTTELNRKYNIDLDKNSLRYTNQYCWEVEV